MVFGPGAAGFEGDRAVRERVCAWESGDGHNDSRCEWPAGKRGLAGGTAAATRLGWAGAGPENPPPRL